ncbi:hypothetical protein NGRA_2529 [Nosema granulosis]|uniref:thymidine kinase n=1 Tax=Nosema granulosis TaxID=83296 RepID=A0A9P6GWI0_9MICR|nr:hypothetical protein NGRA_2529 [Nosema granulosis]
MIIATLGSMGCGKSTALINLYLYIYSQIPNLNRCMYTALYDEPHLKKTTMYNEEYEGPQVSSRIHKGVKAELITNETDFSNIKSVKDIIFIDEFQFIGDKQYETIKDKSKEGFLINIGTLNRSFSDYIWPKVRQLCNDADFIYVGESKDKSTKVPIKTNCMFVNEEFNLIYNPKDDAVRRFDCCTYEFWFKKSVEFLSKQYFDNDFDIKKTLEAEPSLVQPLLRLFDLWKLKQGNKETQSIIFGEKDTK